MFDFNSIIKLSAKPELYEKGSAVMWTDPYISKRLLDIHLNPDIDLASRKTETIQSTVDWILGICEKPGKGKLKMLDLGCGPGLYTRLFAEKDHKVTGVDFSKNSINYAREKAEKENLDIEYRHQNYLGLDEKEQYDLVIMIFTDFGVLNPDDRKGLLSNIHNALKPGGVFIFDVLRDKGLEKSVTDNIWEISENGFWREGNCLTLSNSFLYKKEKVVLYQHCVVEKNRLETYRFWTHFFSEADLNGILSESGFRDIGFYKNVLPESDIEPKPEVMFCRAVK